MMTIHDDNLFFVKVNSRTHVQMAETKGTKRKADDNPGGVGLLKSGKYGDVTLVTKDGRSTQVLRCLLSNISDVFAEAFQRDPSAADLKLDYSHAAIRPVPNRYLLVPVI